MYSLTQLTIAGYVVAKKKPITAEEIQIKVFIPGQFSNVITYKMKQNIVVTVPLITTIVLGLKNRTCKIPEKRPIVNKIQNREVTLVAAEIENL